MSFMFEVPSIFMYASFNTLNSKQVDPSKKFEVFGNINYDEIGQRIAAVEAVDVQERREVYKVLSFYKTVSVHQYTKLSVVGVASIANDRIKKGLPHGGVPPVVGLLRVGIVYTVPEPCPPLSMCMQ